MDGRVTGMAGHAGGPLPQWLPEGARNYLAHTAGGTPIRAIARAAHVHASTILRQVRRYELLRDDPLVDGGLRDLARLWPEGAHNGATSQEAAGMASEKAVNGAGQGTPLSEARIEREGARILRRLAEGGAVLAVARDMEMGVIVRDGPGGAPERLAVVERAIAQALALRDWIATADPAARVVRYGITGAGRAALRRMMAEQADARGLAEAPARFAGAEDAEDRLVRHMRSQLGDSPVTALARRTDRDGKPFLPRELVIAAERLREDFELSQSGPQTTQSWEGFLTAAAAGKVAPARTGDLSGGALAARDRLVAALTDLGPGLSDVALRCCCFLEGLERIEERMHWSARSGKIVLRIALQRLHRHYQDTQGRYAPRIG